MGTVLASKIADEAATLLFDRNYDAFDLSDHLKFINAGQKAAVSLKPDISINNAVVQLVAGTKQSISSTGISFINLTRNMGSDGLTPGKIIRFTEIDRLDKHNPDWHTDTVSATVKLYLFDPKDPKHFYVYPPQPDTGMGYVESIESVIPSEIAKIGDAITIDDIYEDALRNYDIYRALSIDAKQSELALKKAIMHYQLFYQILTGKEITEDKIELGRK